MQVPGEEHLAEHLTQTVALAVGLAYREQQRGWCGWRAERQVGRATVRHLEDFGFIL